MIKLSLLVGLICISSYARAAVDEFRHPLQSSLDRMAELASTLDKAEAEADNDMKSEISIVRDRLGEVAVRVILAPVEADTNRLSRLGVDIVKSNDQFEQFSEAPNARTSAFDKDIAELKTEGLDQRAKATAQARLAVLGVRRALHDIGGKLMSRERLKTALHAVTDGRVEVLRQVAEQTDLGLECVAHFKAAFGRFGMTPVLTGGTYAWPEGQMRETFKVARLSDLSRSEQARTAAALRELSSLATKYEYTCVPVAEMAFLTKQAEALSR